MSGIYETKFSDLWKLLEKGLIKGLDNKVILKKFTGIKDDVSKPCKELDKAMKSRDAIAVNAQADILKKVCSKADSTIAQILKDHKDDLKPAQKTDIGTFRNKLIFLSEDSADALGALQAGTMKQLVGSAFVDEVMKVTITPALIKAISSEKEALIHPLLRKAHPELISAVKSMAEAAKASNTAMLNISTKMDKKTSLVEAKTFLAKNCSDWMAGLKKLQDGTKWWMDTMARSCIDPNTKQPTQPNPKVLAYKLAMERLSAECDTGMDHLASAEDIVKKLGR